MDPPHLGGSIKQCRFPVTQAFSTQLRDLSRQLGRLSLDTRQLYALRLARLRRLLLVSKHLTALLNT